MSDNTLGYYSTADLREAARRRLPKGLFEFMDRGNDDEIAMRDNVAVMQSIKLNPRVLNDVAVRNQHTTLFGKPQQMPVIVAPTGSAGLAWHEGEIAIARAARAHGVPFTLALGSMTKLEKVAEEAGGPGSSLWFQFYMWPEREQSHRVIARAREAGYEALVFTVDTPVAPGREYNLKNGMTIPFKFTAQNTLDVLMHPRWLAGVWLRYMLTTGTPRYQNFPEETQTKITALPMGRSSNFCANITWDDVRKLWPGKLIVKGIQHPQDAVLAADCGADAVVISNHGGRVLDAAPVPILTLPRVVDAVGTRITVIVDSGFRRGADVLKALALGANAVMLGRAPLHGVAAAGEAGALRALQIYRDEIDRVLGLLGCTSLDQLTREHVDMRGVPGHSNFHGD